MIFLTRRRGLGRILRRSFDGHRAGPLRRLVPSTMFTFRARAVKAAHAAMAALAVIAALAVEAALAVSAARGECGARGQSSARQQDSPRFATARVHARGPRPWPVSMGESCSSWRWAYFGCREERVEDAAEIRPARQRAFASGRAAGVDLLTDATRPHAPPSVGQHLESEGRARRGAGEEVVALSWQARAQQPTRRKP